MFAVWKPHVYKQKFKPAVAKWTSFLILGFSIILCSPTVLTIGLNGEDCLPGKHATDLLPPEFIDWYNRAVSVVINVAIPFIGHVVFDSLIVYKLKRAGASTSLSRKEKDVTVSLLLVCVFYLVTTSVIAVNMAKYSTMEVSTLRDTMLRRVLILGAVSAMFKVTPSEPRTNEI